ncbi:MAG: hypothetical protein NZ601_00070 [candidate division WOR-3 bacterium]|nr:hypothetical protein [candidate division WOR-3 bacterium]MCX7756977.1 hypothetical protein [candidate division WOR-3 bacterium]MDW7987938.1 hypothetical protein [candidate division WOR-3 bacterium]
MTIKNILIYLSSRTELPLLSKFTLELTNFYNARLFALTIIPQAKTHLKTRAEEHAWRKLYELEEDAFEADRKISLLLEELDKVNQKTLTSKIIEIALSYKIDLLVLPDNIKLQIPRLLKELGIPVLIFPISKTLKKENLNKN